MEKRLRWIFNGDRPFHSELFLVNSLIPLGWLIWDGLNHRLGANPIEYISRATGVLTLVFLLLTLGVTPLQRLFKLNWLFKQRRLLGLVSFFYGTLHWVTYLAFDREFNWKSIPPDIAKRPFIAIGVFAFFAMIPLAVTSTNAMIKKMGGQRWKRLHQLIYPIAIAGVVHYWMIVKSDIFYPLILALALAILLGYRMRSKLKKLK